MLSADAALSEDVACPNEITKVGGKKKKVATNELKNKKKHPYIGAVQPRRR